jgi:hypothetical protein
MPSPPILICIINIKECAAGGTGWIERLEECREEIPKSRGLQEDGVPHRELHEEEVS